VALGCSIPGGEVTPLFVVGATLGSVMSAPLGLPSGIAAAVCLGAVFGAASNTPVACCVLVIELHQQQRGDRSDDRSQRDERHPFVDEGAHMVQHENEETSGESGRDSEHREPKRTRPIDGVHQFDKRRRTSQGFHDQIGGHRRHQCGDESLVTQPTRASNFDAEDGTSDGHAERSTERAGHRGHHQQSSIGRCEAKWFREQRRERSADL
ncbi:MAG: hypothetical protein EB010_05330, partial [Acidimicrobiia bacterium]|nr:hypothetical protein [Acidimicrobiia bacterium]